MSIPLLNLEMLHPAVLEAFIYPKPEFTLFWSQDWSPGFYEKQARMAFIATALEDPEMGPLLLPEIQEAYALLDWKDLHLDRAVRKALRKEAEPGAQLRLEMHHHLDRVLQALQDYHSPSWLIPAYGEVLQKLVVSAHEGPGEGPAQSQESSPGIFQVWAVELYHQDSLVAGELGYTIGRSYTSLSGFVRKEKREWNHLGKVQMVLLARRLEEAGFDFWNMGHPYMDYKFRLGAQVWKRQDFLQRWFQSHQAPGPQPGLKATSSSSGQ